MTIRLTIIAADRARRGGAEQDARAVERRSAALDSGLDSLCFAILVARLEDVTGVDPFTAADEARFPNTVGELIAFYEHAVV